MLTRAAPPRCSPCCKKGEGRYAPVKERKRQRVGGATVNGQRSIVNGQRDKKTKSQRDKKTKSQRDKKTKRQRVKETKRGRERKRQKVKERKRQRVCAVSVLSVSFVRFVFKNTFMNNS